MKINAASARLYKAIVRAKKSGCGDYELSEILLVAMHDISEANIKMSLTYPKKRREKK